MFQWTFHPEISYVYKNCVITVNMRLVTKDSIKLILTIKTFASYDQLVDINDDLYRYNLDEQSMKGMLKFVVEITCSMKNC